MKKNKKLSVEEALIISLKEARECEAANLPLRTQLRQLPKRAPRLSKSEILAIRKKMNATQEDFAVYLNVNVATIRAWEQGLRTPGDASLRLLQIVKAKGAELLIEISA